MVRLSGTIIAENIRVTTQSACRQKKSRPLTSASIWTALFLVGWTIFYFVFRA